MTANSIRERSIYRVLPFALAALLLPAALLAQSSQIKGEVQNSEGEVVANATLTVLDAEGNVLTQETANRRGKFTIKLDDTTAGQYFIRLEADGYAPTEHGFELEPGAALEATLAILTPQQMAGNTYNQGYEALQAGNDELALELFERASLLDPSLAQAPMAIAVLLHSQKDFEAAAVAIDRVAEIGDPVVQVPPLTVYETGLRLGRDDLREEAVERLAGTDAARDAAVLAYNTGVQAVKDGDVEAAEQWFLEAGEIAPTMHQPYQSLAALQFNEQKYEAALPWLEDLLERKPDSHEGLRMLFFSQASLGNEADAAQVLDRWLEASPEASNELLQQAEAMFENDELDRAQQLVAPLLAAQPANAPAHLMMARIHASSGRIDAAKEELARVIELAPGSAEATTAQQMLEGF